MTIPTNGLDFYLPFDADMDEKIHSLTGTLSSSSAATYFMLSSDTAVGKFLRCIKTQGSSSYYLKYPGSESLMQYGTGDFSLSFWMRAPDWGNFTHVVFEKKYNDDYDGFVVFKVLAPLNLCCRLRKGSGEDSVDILTASAANSDKFIHWCFIRDAGGGRWYCNGLQEATSGELINECIEGGCNVDPGRAIGVNVSNSEIFKIGYSASWPSKQAVFDLKALRIYNRALSDSEITELSQEFSGTSSLDTVLVALDGARDALVTAINAKGGSLAQDSTLYQCANAIGGIESGGTDTTGAGDILSGKTAYVNGEKITGTISSYTGSSLIIPGVEDKVLSTAEGIYLPKAVKVAGDANLLGENIKSGVSIYGIVGTLESSGGTSAEYYKCASVTPGVSGAVIEVTGDTTYGCNGTYTIVDATATGKNRTWRTSDGVWEIRNTNATAGIDRWCIFDVASDTMKIRSVMTTVPDNPWEVTSWQNNTSPYAYPDLVLTPYDTAKTWSGYKAVFDSGTGTWSFESDVTAGLAYTSVTPIVGGIYSADALVIVSLLYTGTPTLTSPTGMTSESSDEWEISASSSYGQHYPWKAFDGQTSLIAPTWTGSSGYSPWWLQWQNKQKQVLVQRLRIQGTDSGDIAQQAITSFILQGSDDGSTWFDLYTASGLTWSSSGYEWKEFTFSNSKSYYYHRLANITATSFPTIIELETYDM